MSQIIKDMGTSENSVVFDEGKEMQMEKKKALLSTIHGEDTIKDLKEQLKDIKEFDRYLDKCKVNKERFELINYLDSGSESNVFSINIIYKNKNGKKIKQKAIIKSIFSQKKERENKKEVSILSKLKNKNIIDFYAYSSIKQGESFFFAMEEAKYGNIRNFQRNILKRYILSESMISFLASQILSALNYCHKCKIAHMDVKLQNVVIDDYLNAKLIDFSISLDYKNKKPNDEIKLPFKGTNFYMSKEVLQSEKIKYQ